MSRPELPHGRRSTEGTQYGGSAGTGSNLTRASPLTSFCLGKEYLSRILQVWEPQDATHRSQRGTLPAPNREGSTQQIIITKLGRFVSAIGDVLEASEANARPNQRTAASMYFADFFGRDTGRRTGKHTIVEKEAAARSSVQSHSEGMVAGQEDRSLSDRANESHGAFILQNDQQPGESDGVAFSLVT